MSATPDAIAINSNTVLNINMSNVTKLNSTNYLMWSLQVNALLDGHGLAGHLDGTTSAPSVTVTVTVGDAVSSNPAFVKWSRQDKLIYSALLGAISQPLQPLVSRTTTASQIWAKLSATYATRSRGHMKQLSAQIKNFTKGTRTIDEYMQGMLTRLDQAAILGKSYDHEDQLEFVLAGLPDDYKTEVDQIEGKYTPPTLTEVHERLLNHEAKLLAVAEMSQSSPFPVSANAVQQRPINICNNNNTRFSNNNNTRFNNNNNSRRNNTTRKQPDSDGIFPTDFRRVYYFISNINNI